MGDEQHRDRRRWAFWFGFRRISSHGTRPAAIAAADRFCRALPASARRGATVEVRHTRNGCVWTRRGGVWFQTEPPRVQGHPAIATEKPETRP